MKCLICGKEFEPYPYIKEPKYCSAECRTVAQKEYNQKSKEKRAKQKEERIKKCPICGEQFNPLRNEVYCSDKCRRKAARMRKYEQAHFRPEAKKKVKTIKGLDDLMETLESPYDYKEWKIAQALKHVTPIQI